MPLNVRMDGSGTGQDMALHFQAHTGTRILCGHLGMSEIR